MVKKIHRFLFMIFLIGLFGATSELLLLEHYENRWQIVPLILIALTLVVLCWRIFDRGRMNTRAFQGMMLLFVLAGFLGILQHYRGNVEFEKEMYPSLEGFALFWKSIHGATPALAPGTMTMLGLIGMAYTLCNPVLTQKNENKTINKGGAND